MLIQKVMLLCCSLLVLGCGKKKKDDTPPPVAPAVMQGGEVVPPKVDDPKVDAPRVADAEPLMIEAVAVAVDGMVEVKPADADTFTALKADTDLFVGDQVRVTGEKGMLRLRMWDDTLVTLSAGGEAVINPGAELATISPSITLLSGMSSLMVSPRAEGQEPFVVYTPSSILAVLGTEFEVGVADSGAMKLGVIEGLVQVMGQDGADLAEVPAGKTVVVNLEGEEAKATPPAPFDPEKEDWEKWQADENAAAAGRVDGLTQGAVNRLEAMKNRLEALENALAKLDEKAAGHQKKAEEAAGKNDAKAYETEAAPLADVVDEHFTGRRENQRLMALMVANTYQLRRIDALTAAGVFKPTPAQSATIAQARAKVEPWLNDFDEKTGERLRARQKRDERLRDLFLKHHPEGRQVAEKTKAELPEFYARLPKADKPRVKAEPKTIPPVKFQPKAYQGKARAELVARPKPENWKARTAAPADPAAAERAKKAAERALRARPKTAVMVTVIPPKFRNRRPAGVGPKMPHPGMGPEDMGPGDMEMGPEDMGMGPEDMGPGDMGMAPEDMGPGDMGMAPEDMGPGDMGMAPEDMGPGDMGPGDMGPGDMGPGDMIPPVMGPAGKGPAVKEPPVMGPRPM